VKTVVTKNDRQALAVKYIVIALSAVIIFFAPDLRYSQAAFELNFDPTIPSGHTYTGTIVNYPYGMAGQCDWWRLGW